MMFALLGFLLVAFAGGSGPAPPLPDEGAAGSPATQPPTLEPPRLRNLDLAGQLAGDPARVAPAWELGGVRGAFAFDGLGYARSLVPAGAPGDLSRTGYWLTPYFEARPWDAVRVNAKLAFHRPLFAYGVARPAAIHNWVGVTLADTWRLPLVDRELALRLRLMDLDRQTLGAGLLLEQKEMTGWSFEAAAGELGFRYLFDGTGGYDVPGDLNSFELRWRDGLVGLGFHMMAIADVPFGEVHSTRRFKVGDAGASVGYVAEAGWRGSARAGLLGVNAASPPEARLRARSDIKLRSMGAGFAQGYAGRIEHDHVTLEQEGQPFGSPMNVLAIDDGVTWVSALGEARLGLGAWLPGVDAETSAPPRLDLVARGEWLSARYFEHAGQGALPESLYRLGLEWCSRDRSACGGIFRGNQLTLLVGPADQVRTRPFNFEARDYTALEIRARL